MALLIAAWIAIIGFAFLVAFQLALALGAPIGHLAWGGQHKQLPASFRWASLGVVVLLVFTGLCVAEHAGIITVFDAPQLTRIVVWGLTVLFGLSTLANLASKSAKERRLGVPLALSLTIACLMVALMA